MSEGISYTERGIYFKDSDEYIEKADALRYSWMDLHNEACLTPKEDKDKINELKAMGDKIGIGVDHENWVELLIESITLLNKYKVPVLSSIIILPKLDN